MRTVLTSSLAIAASTFPAWAHEGQGNAGTHWHGGDLLSIGIAALAVALWVWRRNNKR